MADTNLIGALQGLLHFLFYNYFGVRLLGLAVLIAVVIYVSKQSYQIAKFLGCTLLVGGILTVFGGAWGLITNHSFVWFGFIFLGLIAAMAGRGILDSYGQPPTQAAPQQQMPTPQPVSPYTNSGNASSSAINDGWGGEQRQGKLDHQESYD